MSHFTRRTRLLSATVTTLVLLPQPSGAQVSGSALPHPSRSKVALHDSLTTSYQVGGVRVIHRLTPANHVVAANIYLLGGVRQTTEENAGIELLLLEASDRGTREYAGDRVRRTLSRLGSSIVVDAETDWTMFGLRSTRAGFDSTWSVLASRLMHPTLDSSQVQLVREQLLASVRQRGDNPDALAAFVADTFAFSGHPYARSTLGTEHSLSRLTVEDLRRYHAEQIVTSRLLVVIVGNVTRERVERLIKRTLTRLPPGKYTWTLPEIPPPRPAGFAVEARTLPTNYLLGYYAGPPAGSKDYQALRIAAAVLSGQLFAEIRSRRNLTYAVDAPFVERAVAAGGLYVTTVSPDTTLALMRQQISALQQGTIDGEALDRLVQQFITEYFLNNETNAEQANFLARAQLYRGDFRIADLFVDELREVSPDDVQRVARQYIRNVRFAYVGDPQRLSARALRGF
ncbi:MAG: peptidase domain protein [Geminicoccaceae bacterium]|nr:peptidase domain protein [Geminicoccaceae bacterium]